MKLFKYLCLSIAFISFGENALPLFETDCSERKIRLTDATTDLQFVLKSGKWSGFIRFFLHLALHNRWVADKRSLRIRERIWHRVEKVLNSDDAESEKMLSRPRAIASTELEGWLSRARLTGFFRSHTFLREWVRQNIFILEVRKPRRNISLFVQKKKRKWKRERWQANLAKRVIYQDKSCWIWDT